MMKRFLFIIVGFMLCLWMTSCYSTQPVLLSSQELGDRFVGKTEKEIKQMMGPPTRETSDGGDGTILIYEANSGSTTKVTYTDYNTYYRTTQNPDNFSWFYLDSKGVCTYVKTNCLTKQARAYDSRLTGLAVGLAISVVAIVAGLIGLSLTT